MNTNLLSEIISREFGTVCFIKIILAQQKLSREWKTSFFLTFL